MTSSWLDWLEMVSIEWWWAYRFDSASQVRLGDRGRWYTDHGLLCQSWQGMDRYLGKVSSSVRFWYGVEWEIRTKPSQFHTRCTARVRGKDCSICRFIYPLSRKRWAEPNGIQPIRIQDACSGVCYVGGAYLSPGYWDAVPTGSNRTSWRKGWSYTDSSPWQRNELLRSVIFDSKCYFTRLSQLVVY